MSHTSRRLPRLSLPPAGPPADADLIARFAEARDEVAFELLVRRHAPMVLAVCRRVLADANDADDAFQATFLVLARKASSIARSESLAAWLHRVALRAALRIRADRGRRVAREEAGVEALPAPASDPALRELESVLDEEIVKLPERHRAAFVLCCLEGKTGEEAARVLGCPAGTVSSRLTRARERLRERLTRRGFAPALVLAALAAIAEQSSALPALIESTLLAAPYFVARQTPAMPQTNRSATIAEGVIRSMTATKLKAFALLFIAGLLAFSGALAATDGDRGEAPIQPPKAKDKEAPKPPRAPVVQLVRPQAGGLDRIVTRAGNVEAVQRTDLLPATTGALKSVAVDIGDSVKQGQLLAEIDAPALALDERLAIVGVEQAKGLLDEAEAKITAARAELDTAKTVVKQREAELTAARANTAFRKKQYDRLKELSKRGGIEERVVDEAENHLLTAESQVAGSVASVENAKSDVVVKNTKLTLAEASVRTAKTNVEGAKLSLEKARLALAQTKVVAPFDGVVTRRNCAVGDYVRTGERLADRPLFTIVRADTVRVIVAVSEREIPMTRVGLPAEVTIDALPGMRVSGKVSRVGFVVDPSNRSMRAEIDIPNAKGEIRPGMTGAASLNLGKGLVNALRVPVGAVVDIPQTKPGGPRGAVYVYRDGKARLTPVDVEYTSAKEVEITSGLTANDLVVIDPVRLARKSEVAVDVEPPAPPK